MTKTNSMRGMEALLRNIKVGSVFRVNGYVSGDKTKSNLLVRKAAPGDYAQLKERSAEILYGQQGLHLPGVYPTLVAEAINGLIKSYKASSEAGHRVAAFETESKTYPEMPDMFFQYGEENQLQCVRILRLIDESERKGATLAVTGDVSIAKVKSKIVDYLDLPAGRYLHMIKLEDGKFESIELV